MFSIHSLTRVSIQSITMAIFLILFLAFDIWIISLTIKEKKIKRLVLFAILTAAYLVSLITIVLFPFYMCHFLPVLLEIIIILVFVENRNSKIATLFCIVPSILFLIFFILFVKDDGMTLYKSFNDAIDIQRSEYQLIEYYVENGDEYRITMEQENTSISFVAENVSLGVTTNKSSYVVEHTYTWPNGYEEKTYIIYVSVLNNTFRGAQYAPLFLFAETTLT